MINKFTVNKGCRTSLSLRSQWRKRVGSTLVDQIFAGIRIKNSQNTIKVFEKFADKCRERFTNKHDGNRKKYFENQ